MIETKKGRTKGLEKAKALLRTFKLKVLRKKLTNPKWCKKNQKQFPMSMCKASKAKPSP